MFVHFQLPSVETPDLPEIIENKVNYLLFSKTQGNIFKLLIIYNKKFDFK